MNYVIQLNCEFVIELNYEFVNIWNCNWMKYQFDIASFSWTVSMNEISVCYSFVWLNEIFFAVWQAQRSEGCGRFYDYRDGPCCWWFDNEVVCVADESLSVSVPVCYRWWIMWTCMSFYVDDKLCELCWWWTMWTCMKYVDDDLYALSWNSRKLYIDCRNRTCINFQETAWSVLKFQETVYWLQDQNLYKLQNWFHFRTEQSRISEPV
jgi:hypothetical protein